MWKQYNFTDKSTTFKSIVYYLLFIILLIVLSFVFTGCVKQKPTIIYQDVECNCINPKLDIRNETCICEDGVI